jgi:hypothetical protein
VGVPADRCPHRFRRLSALRRVDLANGPDRGHGLLKELKAPRALEAQIARESLFNDGFAVIVFFALVSVAGLSAAKDSQVIHNSTPGLVTFFLRENPLVGHSLQA